jgi:hypothetical protein
MATIAVTHATANTVPELTAKTCRTGIFIR